MISLFNGLSKISFTAESNCFQDLGRRNLGNSIAPTPQTVSRKIQAGFRLSQPQLPLFSVPVGEIPVRGEIP